MLDCLDNFFRFIIIGNVIVLRETPSFFYVGFWLGLLGNENSLCAGHNLCRIMTVQAYQVRHRKEAHEQNKENARGSVFTKVLETHEKSPAAMGHKEQGKKRKSKNP